MTTATSSKSPAALRERALLCIACSGGCRDDNGAYTLCALCELAEVTVPAA
ncbi:hypothetical protein [Paenarthrobacter sp. YJN-5]|uniref:hypothetical protein n=1 Tax=Paenarthrobacter sp. YJN-5 TaxID=2735316 RepID=UPI00187756EB|nr:hypothetical protein [Paenarthrobacter sp. YJN-5]QOT19290.1 hypothetical protein HMI59_21575 [Paenarthrobacter sp. YJN-5]